MRFRTIAALAFALSAVAVPAAAGGADYAGRLAHEIVRDPEFQRSAPPGASEALPRLMETSEPAKAAEDGFVTVWGCATHMCPYRGGFLAVDPYGGMFAAWTVRGRPGLRTSANASWSRVFGKPGKEGDALPAAVAERFGEWLKTLDTEGTR